jgi:hypothetical protein
MAKEEKEYGVEDLAKYMKRSEATVRGMLRRSKVKRSGKSYSWSSAGAMQAQAKKLGGAEPKAAASKKKSAVKRKSSKGEQSEAA